MTEAIASRTNQSGGRSRLEQAAILLLSVGDQAAAQVMQKLNREEVVLLSETMARLHDVKVNQARQAMNNFFSDYSEQSGINGASRSYLRSILEKALGGEIARSVINGIYGDEIRYRMARLQWVDTPQLAALIDQEHLQLQAVFLAFLPPDIAASVLSVLPRERQDEIIYRVARLDDINRDVIDELDRLIDRGIAVLAEHGSKVVGIKHAANSGNRSPSNQQELLDQLRERDEGVVDELQDDLLDRFGEYPVEVAHLLTVGEIKMNGDRALLDTIRKQQQTVILTLSKVGTKNYSVEQLFEALKATKLKATMGVDHEQMTIKLQIPAVMKESTWLLEIQDFVKALREQKYVLQEN